jgi:hypothetical protein
LAGLGDGGTIAVDQPHRHRLIRDFLPAHDDLWIDLPQCVLEPSGRHRPDRVIEALDHATQLRVGGRDADDAQPGFGIEVVVVRALPLSSRLYAAERNDEGVHP